jgi:DNA-binding FrmR family transcriptional regulator
VLNVITPVISVRVLFLSKWILEFANYFLEGQLLNTPVGYYNGHMIADLKKRALHRSKILEGQMRGVQKMIENEDYCMDIITQTLAIQKSIDSLNKLVLENHLRTHVADMFENGENDKAIAELLEAYSLKNKGSAK